ncbi:MAG TPA: Crp/Fnr family transcriptional regulator [Patescibacteria group bacterium]
MNEEITNKLETFFQKYNLVKYKKGETLFRPGEELPGICFIKKGFVRLYTVTKDGEEVTLQLFKPVFYFSLIQTITGTENHYYFEAITPVEMWIAPKNEVMEYIRSSKDVSDAIMQAVLNGFMDLTTNIEQLISGNAYNKVARIIYSLSNKFGDVKGKKAEIKFGMPHRLIASLTGLTRETVTLQILRLEKEGAIENKGKQIIVKDLDKLKNMAAI